MTAASDNFYTVKQVNSMAQSHVGSKIIKPVYFKILSETLPHYESILSHFFRNYVLNEAPTYYSFWFGLQAVCWGKTRLKLVNNCV